MTQQSLAYLFDESKQEGKEPHFNVSGLLQVDAEGYYYYDSTENYAAYDEQSNSFNVYDTAGVTQRSFRAYQWGPNEGRENPNAVESETKGMFFPFNAADTVFNEDNDGNLVEKEQVISQARSTSDNDLPNYYTGPRDESLNHYFGLSMTTKFVQTTGGMTTHGNQPVTYEFSGDDDVWVFIDGVLVGDLGGIHDAASLKIDFSTGNIYINNALDGNLRQKITGAGVDIAAENWNANTFADGTYHTLKFFYLERGNVASNMNLKFNLVSVPDSKVIKVDQQGEHLSNAEFALYATDASYAVSGNPVASGTTGADGRLTLIDSMDALITFEDLVKTTGKTHFVLRETKTLTGYRKSDDINIEYSNGAVYCTNHWATGAFANANELITSSSQMKTTSGAILSIDENGKLQSDDVSVGSGGTLYAMVLHREPGTGTGTFEDATWKAVYGDVLNGELGLTGEVNTNTYAGVVTEMLADHPENIYELKANAAGLYSVQIDALPGDIQKYYYALGDNEKDQTEFAIAFYYVANGQTHRILDENQGGSYAFSRQFGATFYVPNIKNRISVQKVDDAGNTLEGATFGLYSSSDVTVEDGVATINEGVEPLETHFTENLTKNPTDGSEPDIIDLDGGAVFEGKDGILPTGEYYLAEIAAPSGYEVNKQLTKVVVDEQGVYAHAGVEGDGFTVSRGVGTLVSTMKQFGTNDGIDSTLRDVTAQLQSCDDPTAENVTWTNIVGKKTVHYQYDPDNKLAFLEYVIVKEQGNGDVSDLTIDEGWSNLAITQCLGSVENLHKQDLGEQSLNALFSGFTNVIVANQRTGDLQIQKTVSYYDGIPSDKSYELRQKKFDFEIGLKDAKGSALSGTYNVTGLVVDGETVPSLTFVNGKASVKLAHNDTLTIQGLPIGTQYTIVETLADTDKGFTTTGTCEKDDQVTFSNENRTANGTIRDIDVNVAGLETVLVAFNNHYAVNPTYPAEVISAQKILTGRDWSASDTFTFKLVELANNPVTGLLPEGVLTYELKAPAVTSGTDGKAQDFKFDTATSELVFTVPGIYEFDLYELQAANPLPGVSYSQAQYRYKYVVEDKNGQLEVTTRTITRVTNDNLTQDGLGELTQGTIPVFTNTYNTEAANFTISGTKMLTSNGDRVTPQDGRFSFRIEAVEGSGGDYADIPMPAESTTDPDSNLRYYVTGNDADIITFGPIAFDRDDEGKTYTYRVYEVIDPEATNASLPGVVYGDPSLTDDQKQASGWTHNGVTYDSTWYIATITVATVDGALEPQVSFSTEEGAQDNLVFSNEYVSQPVVGGPVGQKTLTGRAAQDRETFAFTLQADANDQTTVNAVANGTVVLAKSEGTDPVTSIQTSVTYKQLNAEDGTRGTAGFAFNNITFNKADTYRFTITENLPDGVSAQNPTKDGLTYDTFTATTAVTVGEKIDEATGFPTGQLEIKSITYTNPGVPGDDSTKEEFAKFVNTYNATGALSLAGTKNITGRSFESGDSFTFTLSRGVNSGAPMPGGVDQDSVEVAVAPIAGSTQATVNFGTINYTLANVGQKTYEYTLTENKGGTTESGLTYDATTYKVSVAVADKGDGTLTTTQIIKKVTDAGETDVDAIEWTNVYAPASDTEAFAQLGGTKVLTGREWTDADKFTFKLEGANDLTKAAIASGEITFKNYPNAGTDPDSIVDTATKGKVDFSFGGMTFTKATAAGAPYVFKVTEVLPQDDDSSKAGVQRNGVTYDEHAHMVSVSVGDNLQGQLEATVHAPTTSNTWNNTYGATGELDGSTAPKVRKNLVGRNWADDSETFGFKIEKVSYKENAQAAEQTDDATLAAMPAPAETTIQVGKGGGNFGNIAFTKAGIYAYKVSEMTPDKLEDGMSYSSTVYTVTVTVTDNGNGALTAEAAYSGGATVTDGIMTFENALQTKSVKNNDGVDVNGQSVQIGDELTYMVNYRNNQDAASTVTITDVIPPGTEYVPGSASENGSYDAATNKLTWTINSVQPHGEGSVSFQVKVTDAAVTEGPVKNTATVKIGKNGPEISTNPVENPVGSLGNLTISKTVTVEPGQGLDEAAIKAKGFTFAVAFEASAGTTLAAEYQYEGANGAANGTIKTDGTGTVTLKDGQSVTIKDLPHGTKCTVTETPVAGFTVTPTGGKVEATVSADPNNQAKAEFANHYKAGSAVLSGATAPQVKKTLTGRDWISGTSGDAFQFVVEKVSYNDDAATTTLDEMPEIAGAPISSANKDALVPLGGANGVTFSKTGTYVYKVSEVVPTDDDAAVAGIQKEGVTYDEHDATITITVTDTNTDGNYDGNLHASVSYDNSAATTEADQNEAKAAAFTNTYDAGSITLGGEGSAEIEATKTLTGRPQTAGEFTFVVTNT